MEPRLAAIDHASHLRSCTSHPRQTIEAAGLPVPVGSLCSIHRRQGSTLLAETIGFSGTSTLLAPLSVLEGINQGDPIYLAKTFRSVMVSEELIGRVLDASGEAIDDLGPIPPGTRVACDAPPVAALDRPPIDRIMPTQVRAIDAFLTLGVGQRIGVFAGSGLAKAPCLACSLVVRARMLSSSP